MSLTKIAQIGASGNIGTPILNALLGANTFKITVIARTSSTFTAPDPAVNMIKIDFNDQQALVNALKGQDALLINLGNMVTMEKDSNGGNAKVNTATIDSIARTVVAVLSDPPAFKNKPVRIHDFFVTQNEILAVLEEETGTKWTVVDVDIEELEKAASAGLAKGEINEYNIYSMVKAHMWGRQSSARWGEEDDSLAIGLPKKDMREEIKKIVFLMECEADILNYDKGVDASEGQKPRDKQAMGIVNAKIAPKSVVGETLETMWELQKFGKEWSQAQEEQEICPRVQLAEFGNEIPSSLGKSLSDADDVAMLGGRSKRARSRIMPASNILPKTESRTPVKRVIPSEYGNDLHNSPGQERAIFAVKRNVNTYLDEKAQQGVLEYTTFSNGPFFDWGYHLQRRERKGQRGHHRHTMGIHDSPQLKSG
ncbi:NAD(P)-binding protein [Serendipita vermifera]|nr:NAD(P)-binding protein [Serendipita vermifera]